MISSSVGFGSATLVSMHMRFHMNTYQGEGTSRGKQFQLNLIGEATSSHFFRETTSIQQLLFWSSYFFRTAAFFSFLRTVTFSQELVFQNSFFFRAKLLQSSHLGSPLQQLFFGAAIFLEELFRANISKKELRFQSRYFCTASTFSEKQYSGLPTFSGELPF